MTSLKKRFVFLFLLIGLCAANAFSQKTNGDSADVLCSRISEIKKLPHCDEKGVDADYDSLVNAGEKVIPCLLEKVTDTTIMADPRCPHISDKTRVGDVAYFVLVRILDIEFEKMLPSDVQKKFKTQGVYAYHDYIERKNSRKNLQSKLRQLYKQKTSS